MSGRRLFKRILRGYVAVALVLIVVFGACIYCSAYINARDNYEAQAKSTLSDISEIVDTRLTMFRDASNRLLKDATVAQYVKYGSGDYNALQRAVSANTHELTEKGINVYISKLSSSFDKIIGENRIAGSYEFFSAYQVGSGLSGNIRQYFMKSQNVGKVFVSFCARSEKGDAGTLLIIERKMVDANELYVICTYDLEQLYDTVAQWNGSLTMMYGNDMICNIGKDTFKSSDVINLVLKNSPEAIKNGTNFIEGKVYSAEESTAYNWSYVLALPSDSLSSYALTLFFVVLAICCVMFLLAWGLSWLLTKWVYSPVNETVKFVNRYGGEELPDEGLYIRQSFAHIANDNEQLCRQVDETRSPLRTKLLRDLLLGLLSDEAIEQNKNQLGIEGVSGPYRVVLLKLPGYGQLLDAFPKQSIDKIKEQIKEFIDDQLKEQIIHTVIDIDSSTMAVISYGDDIRALRELLADMAMMVEGGFDVEVVGSIGADVQRLSDIAHSYTSACVVMENRFSVGSRNAIVSEDEVNAANAEGFYYPLDIERELIAETIRAHREEVKKILDAVMVENFEKRSLARDRVNAFIFALTASINRITESLNTSADDVFGEGSVVFLDLKMCVDEKELRGKIYKVFDAIIEYIDKTNKLEQDNIAGKMLEYIHLHYNEDISLLDIGGHFNLSQCYTSTLFKEATGENFKDYLSRYRIKMAKQILRNEPGIKNSELAARIGCNTVTTLFRLFNKYEGMSPGQYVKTMH